MIYYIQLDKNKRVKGYSSSKSSIEDLEFEEESLTEHFLTAPFFYVYSEETKKLIYDEAYHKKQKEKKKNRLTNEQKLGQKCSDLEIQMMMLQQLLMQQSMK